MSMKKNLIGRTFGRLTVIAPAKSTSNGRARWICICECSNKTIVTGKRLMSGNTKSCGCLKGAGNRTTHGMSKKKERLYSIWCGMRQRCFDLNSKAYKNYGGRGIGIDQRWNSFKNFFDDMKRSHDEHLKEYGLSDTTLDRKNNNSDYSPENCRWATRSQQYYNSRQALK